MTTRRICAITAGWMLITALAGCGKPPVPQTSEIRTTSLVDTGSTASKVPPPFVNEGDWPGWRGPHRDGVSAAVAAPVSWDETQNVVWKSRLPGHGHSSPVVIGERVYVTTADAAEQLQSVLAVDRRNGQWLWQTDILQGQFEPTMHQQNSQASSTLACDGERLFATFLNDRRIWCSAISLEGEELWRQEVGGFRSRFGYSASPLVYQSLVILAADHQDGGFVAGLDRASGNIVWRRHRAAVASYASPAVISLSGGDQLILSGGDHVTSYDPRTGDELWNVAGTTEATVGTPIVSDGLIILSGGYPGSQTIALNSKGEKVWTTKDKCYVTTPLAVDGTLYLMQDDGILKCLEARTGKELWKHRIGGTFRASPTFVAGMIYVTDMSAKTTVFKASRQGYEQVAVNQVGNECFASLGVSAGQLFLRVADDRRGGRQEWLYCLQDKTPSRRESPPAVSR